MNLILINGSPKAKGSASAAILANLSHHLGSQVEHQQFDWRRKSFPETELTHLSAADALVFSFPLYVDGIPAHLMFCLDLLAEAAQAWPHRPKVYTVVNCGFIEGEQTAHALKLTRFWAVSNGFGWGTGVGIGAGPMLSISQNKDGSYSGPNKPVDAALAALAKQILTLEESPDVFIRPGIPAWAYQAVAHMGWKGSIKRNGSHPHELTRQLPLPPRENRS